MLVDPAEDAKMVAEMIRWKIDDLNSALINARKYNVYVAIESFSKSCVNGTGEDGNCVQLKVDIQRIVKL